MSGRAHPSVPSEQCTATSRRSGERCKRMVVGGGVCPMHGGSAPQVKAAKEARILAAEASAAAPMTRADAADVLTSAMNDSHALLQRLKENIASGRVTSADLKALGDWVDRAARVSKMVVDAGIEERRTQIAEHEGQLIAAVIQRILARLQLTPEQQGMVSTVVPQELRAVSAVSA